MTARIAAIVAFVAGLFMAAQYFFKTDFTNVIYRSILDYYQIIFAVTMLIGGISLLKHHTTRVTSRREGMVYSLITIAGVLFMIVTAAIFGTGVDSPYQWAFNNLQAPMQATMFSLLAFFVASAAYRGFRIRSKPALVLTLTAVIVLVGKSAFGDAISDQLPELAGWVFNHPSSAAKRGMLIGVGLGSVATALRVILGVERSYM